MSNHIGDPQLDSVKAVALIEYADLYPFDGSGKIAQANLGTREDRMRTRKIAETDLGTLML